MLYSLFGNMYVCVLFASLMEGKPRLMAKTSMPQPGKSAPAFSLLAFPEGKIRLSQYKRTNNVVLFFYPRDATPG